MSASLTVTTRTFYLTPPRLETLLREVQRARAWRADLRQTQDETIARIRAASRASTGEATPPAWTDIAPPPAPCRSGLRLTQPFPLERLP